jgi:predicted nucleic acid-binding protein
MTPGPVVSNASPLIALHQIGQLNLLQRLFSTILVPPAVIVEIRSVVSLPAWISERKLIRSMSPMGVRTSLGPGESEAIALSVEVNARWVILDDLLARRMAISLELPVVGTLGILLLAKQSGHLSAVRPCLDHLKNSGFFFTDELFEETLILAREPN